MRKNARSDVARQPKQGLRRSDKLPFGDKEMKSVKKGAPLRGAFVAAGRHSGEGVA